MLLKMDGMDMLYAPAMTHSLSVPELSQLQQTLVTSPLKKFKTNLNGISKLIIPLQKVSKFKLTLIKDVLK